MQDYLYSLVTGRKKGAIAAVIKPLLYLLSLIYGLIVRILMFIYRLKPYKLACRVISVGNITLGGTGKTTIVEFIARYLKEQGYKVAILSRGYKRKITSTEHRASSIERMGDEPYMLQMNLTGVPVFVGSDRIRTGRMAIARHSIDTVILDDGFQQWRLKKDLEIVALSAANPFGNRCLLPRGILRQPLASLREVDIFILTKVNLAQDIQKTRDFLRKINPRALIVEAEHYPAGLLRPDKKNELLDLHILRGKALNLVSGIGDPESFERLIKDFGLNIKAHFRFSDHHPYSQTDWQDIIRKSEAMAVDAIVTTQKDAVRLSRFSLPAGQAGVIGSRLSVFILRVELRIINNEQGLYNRLLRLRSL